MKGLQITSGCKYEGVKHLKIVKGNIFGGLRDKETQRNKFLPSRKKIQTLILLIRNEARYPKVDQDNIEQLKEQWIRNGNDFF